MCEKDAQFCLLSNDTLIVTVNQMARGVHLKATGCH